MSEKQTVEEVPGGQAPEGVDPGVSWVDVLQYGPLIGKIIKAVATGEGSFSTASPLGKLYIRVSKTPFE